MSSNHISAIPSIVSSNVKISEFLIVNLILFASLGVLIFYLVTNYGVWFGGMYSQNFGGLIESYIMGLPFFGYSLISTFIFSAVVESVLKFKKFNLRYFN